MTEHPSPITCLPAVSVAIFHGGAFLLVKRGREPSKGLYAFPGGRVESANRTRKRCAANSPRKPASPWRRCSRSRNCTCRGAAGHPAFRLLVFRGYGPSGALQADDDAETAGWFGIEEMQRLPVIPSVLETAQAIVAAENAKR